MKADILDLNGNKLKDIELPKQFDEIVREDLIKRAVLVVQNSLRHAYGAKIGAGQRYSAKLSRRRRAYKGAYGHGISRVPRKILWHRGTQFGWVGAVAPGTVGGRKAHPPKSWKDWTQKINNKERWKAIRSAIAATVSKEYKNIPLILENKFEDVNKTKKVVEILKKIIANEMERIQDTRIRAGIGKMRGRKNKVKQGPLIVVSKKCNLLKSASNLQGMDIIEVNKLNTALLSKGINPGRITIWTEDSINRLKKENLFMRKKNE